MLVLRKIKSEAQDTACVDQSHSEMQCRSPSFDVPCLRNQDWKKGNKIHSLHAGRLSWLCLTMSRRKDFWPMGCPEERGHRGERCSCLLCNKREWLCRCAFYSSTPLSCQVVVYRHLSKPLFSQLSKFASKAVLFNF